MHKQKQSPKRELWHHVTLLVKKFYYNRHGNLIQQLFTLKLLLHFTVLQYGIRKWNEETGQWFCVSHVHLVQSSSIETDHPLPKFQILCVNVALCKKQYASGVHMHLSTIILIKRLNLNLNCDTENPSN